MDDRPQKLLDQVRHVIALKHYSPRTGETCLVWIKRYILTHVLNRGGLAVRSPLDQTCLPKVSGVNQDPM